MQNQTISLLTTRRTVRSYQEKPIEDEDKKLIQMATLRAPTAGNMALYSVLDIQDQKSKNQLALLCDNQDMIAKAPMVWVFLADYQKWVDYFKGENCEEKSKRPWVNPGWGDLHLGLQDAIIAAQSAVIAADALDIGSCYIGDVLENGEKMQELLNLPEFTIPACMLIFGYKKDIKVTKLTARCPINSIFMKDTYHRQSLEEIRTSYSEQERQSRETKRLPYDNQGSLADYYYNCKYTSSFMKEMNRSVTYWFNRWLASC